MKLYYIPGACSMAAHIVALETGIPLSFHKVDMSEKGKFVDGEDYANISPTSLVPTLILDDDTKLTEAAVIMQYLAAQVPEKNLAPDEGMLHWRLLEVLNFLSTEVHKNFTPLFNPSLQADARQLFEDLLKKRLSYLAENMIGQSGYLVGDDYTIADAYLFTLLGWAQFQKIDLGFAPALGEYAGRISSRPAVIQALKDEGLA
ncbi:glutathione binding-like protein [Salipiger sp. P9]|uniref:glutathione S-transferase N-terminal domain-containing protein n=1 Tax=Salipiger pentaromativorans TaxID=2943193 RepID=UPI0021589D9A|nr:glutathione S-transferase N-terminal domain-containing protein [Salipiger pentaromativorans]MCR8551061.1 glutathione binding-like protein [Salipiger pentaromativorans]